jgi:hypothetical protein
VVLGRHAMGDGPGVGSAGGIRGTRTKGERERRGKTTGVSKGVVELSGNVLKTRVI